MRSTNHRPSTRILSENLKKMYNYRALKLRRLVIVLSEVNNMEECPESPEKSVLIIS